MFARRHLVITAVAALLAQAAMPAIGQAGQRQSIQSGFWSSPATWQGGNLPVSTDTVTIAFGHSVTFTAGWTVRSLVVAGTLSIAQTSPLTLVVTGDVEVQPNGQFLTATAHASNPHLLQVGGNVRVNGGLTLPGPGGVNGCDLEFNGAASCSLTGNGFPQLQRVRVNLSAADHVASLASAVLVFAWHGYSTGFYEPVQGILRVASPISHPVLSAASPSLPAGTGLWVDHPNTLLYLSESPVVTLGGLMRISRGKLRRSVDNGGNVVGSGDARVIVEGGEWEIGGRLGYDANSGGFDFDMSGGTLRLGLVGHSGDYPSFSVGSGPNASLDMTGGEIQLKRGAFPSHDWDLGPAPLLGSGGLVRFGLDESNYFTFAGPMPNVMIGDGAPTTGACFGAEVRGDLTVGAPSLLMLSPGTRLAVGSLHAFGAIDLGDGDAELEFAFPAAPAPALALGVPAPEVVVDGACDGVLARLIVDEPIGLWSDDGIGLATRVLELRQGVVTNHTGNLTLGDFTSEPAQVSRWRGSLAFAPTFAYGGPFKLTYDGAPDSIVTGFEIPPSRDVDSLSVTGAVRIAGGPLTVRGHVALGGELRTADGHELIVRDTTSVSWTSGGTPSFLPLAWVEGPLGVTFESLAPSPEVWYPVGQDSLVRPVGLAGVATGGTAKTVFVELLPPSPPGTLTPPLGPVVPARTFEITSGLNPGAVVRLSYDGSDAPWSGSSARVASAPALTGPYASLGGAVTGTQDRGAVASTLPIVSVNAFYRIAETTPSVRIVAPEGPDTLALGQVTRIAVQTFRHAQLARTDLYVSRTGPAGPWQPIASALPESTHYHWVVSGPTGANVHIRAVVKDTLQRVGEDVTNAPMTIREIPSVGVADEASNGLALAPPWPNPARGEVALEFALPRAAVIRLAAYDVLGREVARLADGPLAAGRHVVPWRPAATLPGGLYFVRLEVEGRSIARRVAVLR